MIKSIKLTKVLLWKSINIIWDKYWKLVVVWFFSKEWRWKSRVCKCDCWNDKICMWNDLRSWSVKSCWCIKKENNKIHWMSETKFYRVWRAIKARCNNKNVKNYKSYGGRWIAYDKKREKFEWFMNDMFPTYIKWLQIDRINNNWNYNKENCRWVTSRENNNNRRNNHKLTHNWITKNVAERARELWINVSTIHMRIQYWFTIENILNAY